MGQELIKGIGTQIRIAKTSLKNIDPNCRFTEALGKTESKVTKSIIKNGKLNR